MSTHPRLRPMPMPSPEGPPAPRAAFSASTWIALALILALAAGVRVWEASRTPFWFDEIFTLRVARLGPSEMMTSLANDMHPPLHFMLERYWIRLGGEDVMWLRSLSILAGLGTVLLGFGLTVELYGTGAGLFAALLLALHRTHVFHSQEARSYALLWMLYTAAALAAWRWLKRGRPTDGVLYVVAATGALYTHYQAGLVLACLGLWGVVASGRAPTRLAGWVGLNALVALAFLPQLGTFLGQWQRLSAEHWMSPVSPAMLLDVFRQLSFGVMLAVVPLAVLALVPLTRRDTHLGAAFLLMVSIVPVLLAYALSVAGARLFTDRYMMFAIPAWCALVAGGVMALPWPRLRFAAGAAIVLVAARTLAVHPPLAEAASLERAEQWLRERVRPGDVVACAESHSWFFIRHHAPGLGEQVLVLEDTHLPYYDGAQFVPEAARVTLASWDSLTAGRRWFGVRARHGGVDTQPILERMLRGASAVEGFDRVTVVEGGAAR